MPSPSTPGFDLRAAVDSLRETFGTMTQTGRRGSAKTDGPDIRNAVLIELRTESMHGYQIIRAIEDRSGGEWKPSPGSVYPTLQLLIDERLAVAEQVGERKVYSLTEAGRIVAESLVAESLDSEPSTAHREPEGNNVQGVIAVTRAGVKFAQALTQVAQNATPEQSARAAALIDEARRKLYAILAEG